MSLKIANHFMSKPKINLRESLRLEIIRVSNEMEFKISTKKNLDKTLIDYLTVRFKLIEPKPREVRYNPSLIEALIENKHPKADEIKRIANVATKGDNLNHFQSKKLTQTNFHDHLANEWNIYHFHLSYKTDIKSGFTKQGSLLLFAYIDDEQIIFLGTDRHKDGVFGDIKWIKILHDFFPEVIAEFKAKGDIKGVNPKVNAKERQTLWNKGYTLGMTEIEGTVYISPGFGRTTSGHNTKIIMSCNNILRWIRQIEKQLEEYHDIICEHFNILKKAARFELRFNNDIELIEVTSNIKLLEHPKQFEIKT